MSVVRNLRFPKNWRISYLAEDTLGSPEGLRSIGLIDTIFKISVTSMNYGLL